MTGIATTAGASMIPVAGVNGFTAGQAITIDSGANSETATVAAVSAGRGGPAITVTAALIRTHAAGAVIAGTGITLATALTRAHAAGTQILTDLPTPGAPNRYSRR
jgi:hypothetical protein